MPERSGNFPLESASHAFHSGTVKESITPAVNAIASVASFILPGLGQLIQNRLLSAISFFAVECLIWYLIFDAICFMLGIKAGWGDPKCLLLPLGCRIFAAYDCATAHRR